MVAVPPASAFTRPAEETVAISGAALTQLIGRSVSVRPSASRTVAARVKVDPDRQSQADPGSMVIVTAGEGRRTRGLPIAGLSRENRGECHGPTVRQRGRRHAISTAASRPVCSSRLMPCPRAVPASVRRPRSPGVRAVGSPVHFSQR